MKMRNKIMALADAYAQNYGSREYNHRAALVEALDAADREIESSRNAFRTYEREMLTLAQEEDEIRAALGGSDA